MKILNEKELAYIVGGDGFAEGFYDGFTDGLKEGPYGIVHGIREAIDDSMYVYNVYKLRQKTNGIVPENELADVPRHAGEDIGDIVGGGVYCAIIGAAIYGAYKLGKREGKKTRK